MDVVNRRRKRALPQFWCRQRFQAAHRRARSRSRFARPYICRLIILSLVMWPSVCPLDHGSTIPAVTAYLSAMIPLAKDASKLAAASLIHSSMAFAALDRIIN